MKTITSLTKIVLVLAFMLPLAGQSQVLINSENFETGLGIWNSGGSNCWRAAGSPPNGNYSILTRSNGVSASMFTNNIDLTPYGAVEISFEFESSGMDSQEEFWLEFSNNGGTTWNRVKTYVRDVDYHNGVKFTDTQSVFSTAIPFSINSRFRIINNANSTGDRVYIDNVIIQGYTNREIEVSGNGISIANNDVTPSVSDDTDFGSVQLNQNLVRQFTISNIGAGSLNISSISLSNTTDFTIVGAPYSTPLASGSSTTFDVQFSSLTLGSKSSMVTIINDDVDESVFTFRITALAAQSFFDSDGDGVFDNDDIDDDNDGIPDVDEESNCENSSISIQTKYKFLNETFGSGNRTTINTTYDAYTSYCYEDGTAGTNTTDCPTLSSDDLNDGEYVVYYRAADGDGVDDTPNDEVASWADNYWYLGEDHTPGDTNGRMAMFNASYDPGIFYTAEITGALPGIPITYSFWVINLDRTDAPGIAGRLRPDILVEFRDFNDNLLASITTGAIPPTTAGNLAGDWYNFTANLTLPVSEFNVIFINNETGGLGNDLAIDDIVISQTLCDTDNDTVADVFDLDADNDGIPDVVEAGFGNISGGTAHLNGVWVDANSNGMHDAVEGLSVLDTDGDGTPNYIDLDSDNDTIFDVDESGAGNTADPNFQNGDGDIDGDGVGDGPDSDTVRETDYESDGISEFYTDGILDIYDYFNGSTFPIAYGNTNQGTGYTYFVKDTDGDGTPDYMDTDSNNDGTYDIAGTLYANLDANNDGIIDDTNDAEGDGILDLFDTDDAAFGSPRDLDRKLTLYFDGRNDYVQDASLTSGLNEATIMGWFKMDSSSPATEQRVFGQDNFYIDLLATKRVRVRANGTYAYYSGVSLPKNQWIHVGATYNSSSKELKLFINGQVVRVESVSGSLNSDSSKFTMGRRTNSNFAFFMGYLDEIRVFDKALTNDEYRKIIYQEIDNNTVVRGTVIPRDVTSLSWSNLIKYYRLDGYQHDITDDYTTTGLDTGTGAKMYNIKVIEYQTAPLPFVTQSGGPLASAVNIPANGVNGQDAVDYDWSIVQVEHDGVTYNGDQGHLGLFINELQGATPIEFEVQNDSELNVSWYLKLDGTIDLQGESQLVQGDDSMLDVSSRGGIKQRQQGTADVHTYNYWGSPVGVSNTTSNNNSYTLPDVMRDGNQNINWLTSGYDGSNTSPIGIADYWIWKFANQPDDDYSAWQHVRSTGTLQAGEGFTMKGPGTGGISDEQEYTFIGKPNNGDINLTLNAGNDYLVGNPYPSAIDAHQFILDNAPTIEGSGATTGTLYFWEHWGGGSHILSEYQGGYAIYNLSGGTPSASMGTNDPDVATGGTPTKTPGRYIPVGQGFFVVGESNGTVNFNNGQRIFQRENATSVFMEANDSGSEMTLGRSQENGDTQVGDPRLKIRIGFNSVNQIRRQLLVTVDELATPQVDFGFDALNLDQQMDDMYWMINSERYIIQGVDTLTTESVLPIGIHTQTEGINEIMIDALLNAPSDMNVYLHDKVANIHHDLKAGKYVVTLDAGEHLDRFEIVFALPQDTLSTSEEVFESMEVFYANNDDLLVIQNPKGNDIRALELYDILGKRVFSTTDVPAQSRVAYEVTNLSTGAYIVQVTTESGSFSKKVLVE